MSNSKKISGKRGKDRAEKISGCVYLPRNQKLTARQTAKLHMEGKMNKAAITKHEIYNKLIGFSEQDLSNIADFIDFMRHKKQLGEKKVVKLKGILKGHDIDLSALKVFKKQTWEHVDQELGNG